MILWALTWIGAILGFAFLGALLLFATVYAYEAGAIWVWAPFLVLIAIFFLAPLRDRARSQR